jgi:kynureninase
MKRERSGYLTPGQVVVAEVLLGWTTAALALRAEMSIEAIEEAEHFGTSKMNLDAATALRAALEMAGAEFLDGPRPGVRLRKGAAQ